MIICNLNTLMAERNLKITKISQDTGISRTTLTSLSSNNSQGIQFETLNTLCMYLNVSPSDFFSYVSFNIKISDNFEYDENNSELNINLNVSDIFNSENIKLFFKIKIIEQNHNVYFKLSEIECEVDFISYFNELSIKFWKIIEIEIKNKTEHIFISKFYSHLNLKKCEIKYTFDWKI